MKFLLENGADIKLKDGTELGVLHWAALKGFEEIVKILVDHGADVNLENRYRATALHMTTHNGSFL